MRPFLARLFSARPFPARLFPARLFPTNQHNLFMRLALLIVVLASSVSAQAVQPWSDPEILTALMAIDLRDEQKPIFASGVNTFMQDIASDVKKIMRSNNPSDMERKIMKKRNARVKAMDKTMQDLLTAEQMPKYGEYKTVLITKMAASLPGS